MTSPEAPFDRDSSLFVARGLYILRYESGAAGSEHPVGSAAPAPGFEDVIQVIPEPGSAEGRLERPGSVALVRAADNGKLRIGVRRRSSNGSLDAAFKLESVGVLSDDGATAFETGAIAPRPSIRPLAAVARNLSGSEGALFLAHVSRRGDVPVKANEWAGGPVAPARIEGLEILGLSTEGLQVEAQVLSGGRDSVWSEWLGVGAFGGTRGQNQALLGVRLRLIGERVQLFILHAEALFLGSAIISERGREVECVSQTQRDPLARFPNLKGIIGPDAAAAPAAARAVQDANKCGQVWVTGSALPSSMRAFVKAGCVKSFFLWNFVDFGYLTTYVLHDYIAGQTSGAKGDVVKAGRLGARTVGENGVLVLGDPLVFNAANVDQYKF